MPHMTKQDIKHEKLSNFGERFADWYQDNEKYITALLVAILLAMAGWKAYQYFHGRTLGRAGVDLSTALQNYSRAMNEPDDAKRQELLATVATEGNGLFDKYPDLYAGRMGLLLAGNAKYYTASLTVSEKEKSADTFKAAQEAFQKYIQNAKTNEEKAAGQFALGQTLENLLFRTQDPNLRRQAQDAYEQARKLAPGTYLDAEASLAYGRLLQVQPGRQDEARKIFEQVAKDRKVAPPAHKKESVQSKVDNLTPAQVDDIRTFAKTSYAEEAQKALTALKGVPQK